ncbi:hypothetical protein [Chitinophaga varians]|uniref:hypothetical protein n=1 Tax=Chitinophaga varians TaxID=2202339 RepID=UPI00165FA4EC|nr:hypothetical protein [Chitinophaga varians]MBC9915193.1 hypothetical protein [Chitinophaga varians]
MTALALLLQIMQYEYREGDIDIEECLPKQLRLTQIVSLAHALGYYDGSTAVTKAWQQPNVLRDIYLSLRPNRETPVSPALREKILAFVAEHYPEFERRALRGAELQWMFIELYDYRKRVLQLLYSGGSMLEGFSGGLFYAQHLTGKVNKMMAGQLADIDEALWELADPAKRVLDKLPESYPDEQTVKSAELQWRMDHY